MTSHGAQVSKSAKSADPIGVSCADHQARLPLNRRELVHDTYVGHTVLKPTAMSAEHLIKLNKSSFINTAVGSDADSD